MYICIVYDCLFPWTIGGAERWYRNLAERLVREGHQVDYYTLTQWDADEPPILEGVRVIAAGPRLALYNGTRRTIWAPLRFGMGVFMRLLRDGRRYDVVHTASFPFFSLLAIAILRPFLGYRVVCDWHEVWSLAYWKAYLGPVAGRIGAMIQWLCAALPQRAYSFSRLHADRLRALGRSDVTILTGEYEGGAEHGSYLASADPPELVYAGRMIAEKRITLLIDAIAVARQSIPGLRARIFGQGPEYPNVQERVRRHALEDNVTLEGFVESGTVDYAMRTAFCIVQPSSREGYGMVVVEASARGVPAVVVAGEDNAAVELIDEGLNGFVATAAEPEALAAAILHCWRAGEALRLSTRQWYAQKATQLSLETSLRTVVQHYSSERS